MVRMKRVARGGQRYGGFFGFSGDEVLKKLGDIGEMFLRFVVSFRWKRIWGRQSGQWIEGWNVCGKDFQGFFSVQRFGRRFSFFRSFFYREVVRTSRIYSRFYFGFLLFFRSSIFFFIQRLFCCREKVSCSFLLVSFGQFGWQEDKG